MNKIKYTYIVLKNRVGGDKIRGFRGNESTDCCALVGGYQIFLSAMDLERVKMEVSS
jgi:hypothetical protein